MSKSIEQVVATTMRTTIDSVMRTTMIKTNVVRIIKFMPKNSNQAQQKALCYDSNGIVDVIDFNYGGRLVLSDILPNRITVIEDTFYITKKKEFDFYESIYR